MTTMIDPPKTSRELVLRAQGGGTALELARKLGTTERTIRRWLSTQAKPSYDQTMEMLKMIRDVEN